MVLSECVCPGRELRLQCTVVGGGITKWSGTAFDCSGQSNVILLRHSQFELGRATGECNNGMHMIIGHNLNRTFDGPSSTFTSQLIIHLPLLNPTNNTLEGETVECIFDNGLREMTIGTHTIAYTREGIHPCIHFRIIIIINFSMHAAPPPNNVHLAQVSKNTLTFQWGEPGVCPLSYTIGYEVNAMNCGVCPNTTLNTSITCNVSRVFTSNTSISCTLAIETTVCGSNVGNKSDTLTAILKGIL